MIDSNIAIKGFVRTRTTNVKIEIILWGLLDDDGKDHNSNIPNSYYVPHGKVSILSSQHWARTHKHTKPIQVTGERTVGVGFNLFWNHRN